MNSLSPFVVLRPTRPTPSPRLRPTPQAKPTPQIGNIKFHLERLYLYTSRQGKLAFWRIKVPKDNRENTWLESAVAAAEEAMEKWVCISSNQQARIYTVLEALGVFSEPDWPQITQGKTARGVGVEGCIVDLDKMVVSWPNEIWVELFRNILRNYFL